MAPIGRYKGQKLRSDVTVKSPARTKRIMPSVPVTTSVRNKTKMIAAILKRMILSMFPTFFFMSMIRFVSKLRKIMLRESVLLKSFE